MKLKNLIIIIGSSLVAFFLILILVGFLLVESWRKTPYGKLEFYTAFVLKLYNLSGPDRVPRNAAELRSKAGKDMQLVKGKIARVKEIKAISIPGTQAEIPARLYKNSTETTLPVIIFYHGGGWVVGGLESYDNVCRILCRKSGAIVVSIDYRLAPEHPFPAAVEDAYQAVLWASGNIHLFGGDPAKIAVCGDSAGGNLAAAVSLMARDRGKPALACQVLIYPVLDVSNFDTPSYKKFALRYLLTRQEMEWYRKQYVPDSADWKNPLVSPLRAENLDNLPPALVITNQFDVLHDEGEEYAARLEWAGVAVQYIELKGMIHGFISMTGFIPQAQQMLEIIADEINRVMQQK